MVPISMLQTYKNYFLFYFIKKFQAARKSNDRFKIQLTVQPITSVSFDNSAVFPEP